MLRECPNCKKYVRQDMFKSNHKKCHCRDCRVKNSREAISKWGKRNSSELTDKYVISRLKDTYRKRRVTVPSHFTEKEIISYRESVLLKRELKEKGYASFYSIFTRKPSSFIGVKKLPISNRKKLNSIKRDKEIEICNVCGNRLPRSCFRIKKNGYAKSTCMDCARIQAREKQQRDSRSLHDNYIKNNISTKYSLKFGEIPNEMVNVCREVLRLKRAIVAVTGKRIQNLKGVL